MRLTILMLGAGVMLTGCGQRAADPPPAERPDTTVAGERKDVPKPARRAIAPRTSAAPADTVVSAPAAVVPSARSTTAPAAAPAATAPRFAAISPPEMTFGKVPTVEITGKNLEGATLLLQTEEEAMALKPVEASDGRIVLWREGAPDPLAPGTYSVVIVGKDRQQVMAKNVFTVRPAAKP